jgi:geranylgeranyl reductase family protein
VVIQLSEKRFDVLIVGAGPAGTAAAIELGRSGLAVAVLEKAKFPRDKTCGDALSVDVINQLSLLAPELATSFQRFESKTPSFGVSIYSPGHHRIDIPFIYKGVKSAGYICKRLDFDNLLLEYLKKFPSVQVFENCKVEIVEAQYEKIAVQTSLGIFSGKMLIGADGARSIVAKKLALHKTDKEHNSAGLRIYYEGITSFHPENFIELYFFREILPGYLWIFPLPGNKANVGIGMLSSVISKKNIDLKNVLKRLLTTDPRFKERFKNAQPLETVKGYNLPLGSKKRNLSGDHFLLTGDAASLIDPFSGEGIANAIRSGRVAAAHTLKCFQHFNFSKAFNAQYDQEIYRRMWKELKLSRTLQQLCRYPFLFNFIVKKATQNKEVHQLLIDALAFTDKKKKLLQPGFYYRLLFNKKI